MKYFTSLQKPLTPQELADFYSVSINTIYFWVSRSEFPKIKVGRHLRFDLDRVKQYFGEQSGSGEYTCQTPDFPLRRGRSNCSLKTKVNASRVDLPKREKKHGDN